MATLRAILDLRNRLDYRQATPDAAALRALIVRHRAVAAWAIARDYLRPGQLESVEPSSLRGSAGDEAYLSPPPSPGHVTLSHDRE